MGINNCCSIVQNLVGTSIGTDWKFEACFYCQNTRRVARTVREHFCTRFMLEIYLTLRSAMRKVTACFYPQNVRHAAQRLLSAEARRPKQWVNTLPRGNFVTWCPGLPEFQRSSTGCQCVHLFCATDANGRFVTYFRTSNRLFVSMEEVRVTLCRRKVWEFIGLRPC